MLFRMNLTRLFPGWCWNFMRTPKFRVDATCKLPNKCHNLCASANFLDRPKMLFILFAGYVWISIISPYREDLRCTSVVTSLPCAGAVDVCHQRSQQRQVIVDRWRWRVEPTFACCFLSATGFCWIPLFTCCKKYFQWFISCHCSRGVYL